MNRHDIVVIGTSAGGLETLITLITPLEKDLPAAVFIVLHLSAASSAESIVATLQKHTVLPCKVAEANESITYGTIYLAPADCHLLLTDIHIRLTKGPRENGFRPSIDTLFRSAAAYHGSRAIGVILTGMLYDGIVGMDAIRRSKGITIVQDPSEAPYRDMPGNVLLHMDVNYNVPAAEIGILINELVYRQVEKHPIPDDIKVEAAIAERITTSSENVEELGERSVFICPDCGGPLWQMKHGNVVRYRCHAGHAYTAQTLLEDKDRQLEETLWMAMRILEERKNMLISMVNQMEISTAVQAVYEEKIEEVDEYVSRIKRVIMQDISTHEVLRKQTEE
ncbi:chemotaxis protein CheB [Xanthocytophaga agilis]|uniref:protein-glutamate methylesterase n=1 Tax=Xanthocytophaga agilis TaxID=3048010 RepID=A0AAE3UIW0_9BACT|nr:chemotaxis protein CheB [Xanthocytophaga agilis]MDJ1505891.1 chemotaxis protein CheB [Xanthocytophaga agilis]